MIISTTHFTYSKALSRLEVLTIVSTSNLILIQRLATSAKLLLIYMLSPVSKLLLANGFTSVLEAVNIQILEI